MIPKNSSRSLPTHVETISFYAWLLRALWKGTEEGASKHCDKECVSCTVIHSFVFLLALKGAFYLNFGCNNISLKGF